MQYSNKLRLNFPLQPGRNTYVSPKSFIALFKTYISYFYSWLYKLTIMIIQFYAPATPKHTCCLPQKLLASKTIITFFNAQQYKTNMYFHLIPLHYSYAKISYKIPGCLLGFSQFTLASIRKFEFVSAGIIFSA